MKIKFIYPKFDKFLECYSELAEYVDRSALGAFTLPPALGIPILINLLPKDIEWVVEDQNIEPINYDDNNIDLIAISFFTPQAYYAYEIGDEFIKRGKTVIMGGMHPSMIPDDVMSHCTSVCIGEGETVWLQIIDDFKNNALKKVYKANTQSGNEIGVPKTGIFKIEENYDWHVSLINLARGCIFNCDWCNIPVYLGKTIRFRPIEDIKAEISKLEKKKFYLADDLLLLNYPIIQDYMTAFCEAVKDMDIQMFLSSSPAMNADLQFLDLIAKAGAKTMYVVFASDPVSVKLYQRDKDAWKKTISLVKNLEDRGIKFFGSFGVGFDCMYEDQFDLILEFCEEANILTAEFFIATPFPNSRFWVKLNKENRLFHPIEWKKYNCANVVFKPKYISEDKLLEGFLYLWKNFHKRLDIKENVRVLPRALRYQ